MGIAIYIRWCRKNRATWSKFHTVNFYIKLLIWIHFHSSISKIRQICYIKTYFSWEFLICWGPKNRVTWSKFHTVKFHIKLLLWNRESISEIEEFSLKTLAWDRIPKMNLHNPNLIQIIFRSNYSYEVIFLRTHHKFHIKTYSAGESLYPTMSNK